MTVEHKTERQAVVLHHKLLIVRKAEAEPVGILPYVRLHHSRSHYIFADMLLNRISHTADRTALTRLEHFVYRYCKYTFSHFFVSFQKIRRMRKIPQDLKAVSVYRGTKEKIFHVGLVISLLILYYI